MKILLLVCAGFLLLGLADLPIGYFTFLRILVTIGAISVIATEFQNGINFWVIAFGLLAILFNPIIPVYLGNKDSWAPFDFVAAVLFAIKAFNLKGKA